jgi:DNA polymerase
VDQRFATLADLNAALAAAAPPATAAGLGRVVPGEGPADAAIAFVGEQPGDEEDRLGRPFVGPAGRLLDRALAEAGIDRERAYLTNAVKRFNFAPRGSRRIHRKPSTGEVRLARWWLERELDLVDPGLVVALGATAGLALDGRPVAVGRERGAMMFGAWRGFLTVHPSYLLRLPGAEARDAAYAAFVADLAAVRQLAGPRA